MLHLHWEGLSALAHWSLTPTTRDCLRDNLMSAVKPTASRSIRRSTPRKTTWNDHCHLPRKSSSVELQPPPVRETMMENLLMMRLDSRRFEHEAPRRTQPPKSENIASTRRSELRLSLSETVPTKMSNRAILHSSQTPWSHRKDFAEKPDQNKEKRLCGDGSQQ